MKFSKKKLLSLIESNMNEMAMDYDTPDRPHGDISGKLATGETPLQKVPLPKTGREEGDPSQNFQELLASERYKQVVSKVRQYTGENPPMNADRGIGPLTQMMMSAHNRIVQTERAHRTQLEQLAVELVMKEMGIPEGSFQWDVKIVGMGEIDTENFNRENQQQQEPQIPQVNIEVEEELMTDLEQLNLEKAKRRLMNAMIQGASKKGHYMYHLVPEKIQEITGSETLLNDYGILMSINDSLYWQLGDDMMQAMMNQPGGVGGKEEVDTQTDPPTIKVRALNFPICVHECIKGIMEIFAVHGQPEDTDLNQAVSDSEDTLEKEMWDLRLGPAIWDRIRLQMPEDILTDENKVELQNYLLMEIFKLPAKKFLVLCKEVISGSEAGKRLLSELTDNIVRTFNDIEIDDLFNNDLEELSNESDGEDLKDWLGSLGVGLSDENGDDNEEDDDDGGEPVLR
jgi:hypothetical protein